MCDDMFYGSVTVGERGQVSIPAEARSQLGIQPGEKLLVMRHPHHKGLMLFKIQDVKEFLEEMTQNLERVQKQVGEHV